MTLPVRKLATTYIKGMNFFIDISMDIILLLKQFYFCLLNTILRPIRFKNDFPLINHENGALTGDEISEITCPILEKRT